MYKASRPTQHARAMNDDWTTHVMIYLFSVRVPLLWIGGTVSSPFIGEYVNCEVIVFLAKFFSARWTLFPTNFSTVGAVDRLAFLTYSALHQYPQRVTSHLWLCIDAKRIKSYQLC